MLPHHRQSIKVEGVMSNITKRALETSLKNLLKTKHLDKITIQDLTEDCGISRAAFYYHFQDIYSLVEWACEEDFSHALGGKNTYDTWEEGFTQIFDEIYKDKDFIYNVYRYTNHDVMIKYLHQRTFELLYGVIEEKSVGLNVTEEQKSFIADFYKYSFVGIVLDWVDKGMKKDTGDLVKQIGLILHGNFERALMNYNQLNRKP